MLSAYNDKLLLKKSIACYRAVELLWLQRRTRKGIGILQP